MAAKSDVLYKTESKPKRKSNTKHKPAKEMKEDDSASDCNNMETFQQQALEVREPGPDFDPTEMPKDGEEYLMHMLYERRKCPPVMVRQPKCKKNNTTAAMAENFTDQEESLKSIGFDGPLPTKEWKDYQLGDFEDTRKKIMLLRLQLHKEKYEQTLEPPLTSDPIAWRQFCQENPPYLKIILRFSQRTLEQLLEFICEWLRGGDEEEIQQKVTTEEPTPSTSNAASEARVNETPFDFSAADAWLGTWLYAALTCLHIPIEPEVHSTLRDIARLCIRLRSRVPGDAVKKAIPYHLFIFLIAKAFGQMDFAEFV